MSTAKTYLSDQKIKTLTDYFERVLPTKTRSELIKIKSKYGLELYSTKKENRQRFWNFAIGQMKQKGIYNENKKDVWERTNEFVNENYPNEWKVLNAFDAEPIWNWYYNFVKQNFVERLEWLQLVECSDYQKLFTEKYSKKNVDPQTFKKTNELLKIIEKFYNELPDEFQRNSLKFAFDAYLIDGDEQLFFNKLNYVQR